MGVVGVGRKAWLQIGKATTWGTSVAATGLRYEVLEWSIKPEFTFVRDRSLYDGVTHRQISVGVKMWRGTFKLRLNYRGFLKILEMAMGQDAAAPVTPAVTGPNADGIYTHIFYHGGNLSFYTAELLEAGVDGATTVADFEDVVCQEAKFMGRAAPGDESMCTCEITILSRNRTVAQTAAALSFWQNAPVFFGDADSANIIAGSDAFADTRIRSWSFTVRNPLTDDRLYFGGGNQLDQVLRADFSELVVEMEQEWQKQTQYADLAAGTARQIKMRFRDPVAIGASNRYIEFDLPLAKITDFDPPINVYREIMSRTRWEAYDSRNVSTPAKVTVFTDVATVALG